MLVNTDYNNLRQSFALPGIINTYRVSKFLIKISDKQMILYNQKEQTSFRTSASFEAILRMVDRLISLKCFLISINL